MPEFDDLQGSLHAAALLFLAAASGGFAFAYRSRWDKEKLLRTSVLTVLIGAAFYLFGVRYREFGLPWMHFVILLACAWAGSAIGSRRIHHMFGLVLLAAGCAVLIWHAVLVQTDYVGRRDWIGESQLKMDRDLQELKRRLKGSDSEVYSAGWLEETDLWHARYWALKDVPAAGLAERPRRLWHTWLTGLYARIPVRRAVWYPGGRLGEGAPRMEWRDRQ